MLENPIRSVTQCPMLVNGLKCFTILIYATYPDIEKTSYACKRMTFRSEVSLFSKRTLKQDII
jgi:hypothetical protein